MTQQPLAILDLGTNTFHLLVVHGAKIISDVKRPVRIGLGGINAGIIHDDAVERSINCLRDYRLLISEKGAKHGVALATSAFRNAKNGNEVAELLERETGIAVNIISGEQESALIYEGIRFGMNLGKEKALIVDIGGGSVEFIIGNGNGILWKESFETGGQRLIEMFQDSDPISDRSVSAVGQHLEKVLSGLSAPMASLMPSVLIGSSGSFDTLSEMHCIRKGIAYEPGPETPLDFLSLETLCAELVAADRNQRMQMPGMIELRVDMIVVASILIQFICRRYPFNRLRVSGYSLKEGLWSMLLQNHMDKFPRIRISPLS